MRYADTKHCKAIISFICPTQASENNTWPYKVKPSTSTSFKYRLIRFIMSQVMNIDQQALYVKFMIHFNTFG